MRSCSGCCWSGRPASSAGRRWSGCDMRLVSHRGFEMLATSYAEEARRIAGPWSRAWTVLIVLVLLALPVFGSARLVSVTSLMLITAIVVVGLQINTGLAGQINMGAAAFMGVGSYTAAVLSQRLGCPFWLAIPLGGVSAAAFGMLFA